MSKEVDERVVSLQLDNKNLESNAKTSMSTLDKLEQKLNFKGITKGVDAMNDAVKKTDMSVLGRGVESVQAKFSALQVMGVTALANITNQAVNAGKRIVSALTIDPIKTGFQEYETQINSVQTILANTESKGSTLQDVNNALSELNTYADKTIYNFTEMTRNIGTFTAAGVDLDTSVSAIKGIANLAAVSGSTSQQASTAMYQLSQALSSGTVKLQDWNSVVNAGMGGQVFQDALKETARVHNIAIDDMITKNGSFRETLQEGWLTSEILTETLEKFTGDLSASQLKQMGYTDEQIEKIVKMGQTANDAATKVKTFTQLFDTMQEAAQSGWTKTWEILIGDFGEAKELLTEISNMAGDFLNGISDSRNELLGGALSTGWKQLLNEGITDAAGFEETVTNVAKAHGTDLSKMINDETTFQDTLKDGWLNADILSESIENYGAKLKGMSKEQLEAAGYTMQDVKAFEELETKLKDGTISLEEFTKLISRPSGRELLIESLRNSLRAIIEVIKPVTEAFREIFPATTADQLYGIIEKIRDFTASLTINEQTAGYLKRTFKGIFALFDIGYQIVKALFSSFSDLADVLLPSGDGILGFTASIGDFIVGIDESVKKTGIFKTIIQGLINFLRPISEGIASLGKSIVDSFKSVAGIAKTAEARFEPLTTLGNFIKNVFVGIGKIIGKVLPFILSAATAIGSVLSDLMNKISSAVQESDYTKIFDFINGGIFSAIGIYIAKFIKSGGDLLDNAGGFLDSFKDILSGVSDSINAFSESIKAKTLKTIATALAILAASLFVISLIDSEKLTTSLGAVAALFGELMISMNIFGKIADGKSFKSIGKITRAMISLSVAVLVLALAMKIMGSMSWGEMFRGLIATGVGLGLLVGAVKLLPDTKIAKASKAIKKLASAMLVLAIAMKIMSSMSWDEMWRGLIATGVGLGALVVALNLLPKDTGRRAAGMIALATSMVILGVALKIMSSMSWDEMWRGLVALAGSLALIVGAMALMKKALPGALAMMIIAPAIVVLASALKIMASMSWDDIFRSLTTLGISLLFIVGAMAHMKKALPGAAALFVVSAALMMLAPVLKILGSMSWGEIIRGLAALAGAFLVIGVAGKLLGPLIPAILGLAGAIALIGVGILAAGVGVAVFAAGLTALAAALAVSGGAIVTFVASIIGLIPYLIQQIGIGIVSLCEVIAGAADAICAAVTTIILAVVKALVTCVPTLVEGVLTLIVELLKILITYLPQIVPLLVDLFVKLIDVLVNYMPPILDAIFKFLIALIKGIASRITGLIEPLVSLFGAIFKGIAAVIGPVVQEVIAPLLAVLLDHFANLFEVLAPYIPDICDLFEMMTTTICDAIVAIVNAIAPYLPEITAIVQIISEAVVAIIDDIVRLFEQISPILDSIGTVISETGDAIKDALDGISGVIDSVGSLIQAFFDGISGVIDSVGEAALNAGAGFEKLANGVKTITKLKLADMAASLAAVATGLGKITKHSDGISKTGTGMKRIADGLKTSNSSLDGMADCVATLIKNLNSIGPTATKAANALSSAMSGLTAKLTTINSSIVTATSSITTSISKMATSCITTINDFKKRFVTAGTYLMSGLASGIRSGKPSVLKEARSVAKAVESTIRAAWQVNSPSKLFYKIALGIGEGIENALGYSANGVENSALDLADSASVCITKAVSRISDIINGDIDAQPTIRPVLDLSDIRDGASTIGDMFSDRTLSVGTDNIGAVASSMSRYQNGRNSNELASQIKGLRSDLNNTPRNTYSINGISVEEGSSAADAIRELVRYARVEGRA